MENRPVDPGSKSCGLPDAQEVLVIDVDTHASRFAFRLS
jgi:hypothetical protein